MQGSWRARALIDSEALSNNIALAKRQAPQSQLMAVVKANAYGHGVSALATALAAADSLAVITVNEAREVREAALQQPICILQGVNTVGDLRWCVSNLAAPALCNLQQVRLLADYVLANPTAAHLRFWIKLDTGMHRLGLNAEQLAEAVTLLRNANLAGPYATMAHFACADSDAAFTLQQIQQFESSVQGVPVQQRSLANSAALIDYPQTHGDCVRPGIMLYGATPFVDRSAQALGLKPVMSLQAKVAAIHRLAAGEGVGYGMAWRAEQDCSVAVLTAGYGDGVPRNLPAGVPVAVGSVMARSVGRVSMDSCFVLLEEADKVEIGDVATLWGQHHNGQLLPVDDVAAACGTIGYELLTRVSARVLREIKG